MREALWFMYFRRPQPKNCVPDLGNRLISEESGLAFWTNGSLGCTDL